MNFDSKPSDDVHWYWNELASEIVAESGIPGDCHHLGKILMKVLKENPDLICQIDGATDEYYTNKQVLEKSVQCARACQKLGIQKGDVVLILGPNHVDLTIPLYSSFYIGATAAGIDRTLQTKELSDVFTITRPKIIFCQDEKSTEVQQALLNEGLEARIITFDEGKKYTSFNDFLETFGGEPSVEDFKITDFDPADTIIYLLSTSGTTGLPKLAAITHKNLSYGIRQGWTNFTKAPECTKLYLNLSPLQWQSGSLMHVATPILKVPRLQTSGQLTQKHFHQLLKKYQPTMMMTSPNLMATLMKSSDNDLNDLSSFQVIYLGGSLVSKDLMKQIEKITPKTQVLVVYGASEISTLGFTLSKHPFGTVGIPAACYKYRLVNTETNEIIMEPNQQGELWLKGPTVFKGYYRNPEETAKVILEDGWIKTGDVLYRDENDFYFFSDRYKFLLKYMNHQISPTEVEQVISAHPGVLDVVVTSRPDPIVGDLVVAAVVPRPGIEVKEEEIINLVKENLTDSKHIRGGVIFLKEMPLLPSGKVDRRKLKTMAAKQ